LITVPDVHIQQQTIVNEKEILPLSELNIFYVNDVYFIKIDYLTASLRSDCTPYFPPNPFA